MRSSTAIKTVAGTQIAIGCLGILGFLGFWGLVIAALIKFVFTGSK